MFILVTISFFHTVQVNAMTKEEKRRVRETLAQHYNRVPVARHAHRKHLAKHDTRAKISLKKVSTQLPNNAAKKDGNTSFGDGFEQLGNVLGMHVDGINNHIGVANRNFQEINNAFAGCNRNFAEIFARLTALEQKTEALEATLASQCNKSAKDQSK